MRHICTLLLATTVGAAAVFEPAKLVQGEPPTIGPLVVGWSAEMVVARLDPSGRVREIAARNPATVLGNVVGTWTFEPARLDKAPEAAQVLVAAIMRPATSPDIVPPPDLAREATWLPDAVPHPTATFAPPYPARRIGNASVVVEMLVSTTGSVERTRIVGPESGFDDAAVGAAASWHFEPARRDGTAVPAFVYAVFGFREPVVITRPIPRSPGVK
jgi:TonB family protein